MIAAQNAYQVSEGHGGERYDEECGHNAQQTVTELVIPQSVFGIALPGVMRSARHQQVAEVTQHPAGH